MKKIIFLKKYLKFNKIKWCIGCGNYSILIQFIKIINKLKIKKNKILLISGIGCSSRFPYYVKLNGIHTIHGRVFSIATGIKLTNKDLNIWVITGDGDSFSIGLNHLIHTIKRNIDLNIIIFNNGVLALTKGKKNNIINNNNFNILSLLLNSGATYIARTLDSNPSHLRNILLNANKHIGTSCIEIIQNCPLYNKNIINLNNIIYLKNNKKLIYNNKCIILNNFIPKIKKYNKIIKNIWIHNIYNYFKSFLLLNLNKFNKKLPFVFGIIYKKKKIKKKKNKKKKNKIKKKKIKKIIKKITIF
ncbi:MAG: thiamine pyrophosphate-dependent enzyme [Candidatus Shikimatogenerans sp. JK-2022]|nr:thiamine pyrophosphate-dependent enzyme [Candidatus Shikimatogenerans bostrichidophilus]